jgi:GTP-binding protein
LVNDAAARPPEADMPWRRARFLTGARTPGQLPPDAGREVAFAGRSNAGKSSLINVLTEQKALARTSKAPGRTREINFFGLDDAAALRLVDLPGYGYAKVPEAVRRQWQETLARYLQARRSLAGVVVIMDVRHPLTEHDRTLLAWLAPRRLPLHLVLTKADKLKRGRAAAALEAVRREAARLEPPATAQLFSALHRQGLEILRERLASWLAPGIPGSAARNGSRSRDPGEASGYMS